MTELEMALTLGIIIEPEKNFVHLDPVIIAEINYLKQVFNITKDQRKMGITLGTYTELLPWIGLN